MLCSLEDYPSLPEGSHVPLCLTEGKVHYSTPDFCNVHIYTSSLSSHPRILISNEVLHPIAQRENGHRVFLPISQTIWKKLQHTWYEKGFVPMLEVAADPKENQGFFVLEFVAKQSLNLLNVFSSLNSFIPGYKRQESGEVLVVKMSQNPVYTSSNIRCLAWHPHYNKLAVAASDDSVRIYTHNSQLVPLLKYRAQHLIACLAWRPLCVSELAVGCEAGVVVWHVDPNSVITRPSASNTQILSRPNHTHVTSLAWSPQGDLLVSGSARDSTMYVWAPGLNKSVPLRRVQSGGISFLTWSHDSLKLFAATTNTVFRVWETCRWEPEKWTLPTGRVVSAVWSPCSSLVLFAVSHDPKVYRLSCTSESTVYQDSDASASSPIIDLTPMELDSGERVGGEVASLAWDSKGRYLAVMFKHSDIIAIFLTTFTAQTLKVFPCCLVKGLVSETPATISFQENFEEGANLTIGWSSGRVQYFPIIYRDILSQTHHLLPEDVSSTSPFFGFN